MRRLRIDATAGGISPAPDLPPGHSGRRVVIAGVLLGPVIWGGSTLASATGGPATGRVPCTGRVTSRRRSTPMAAAVPAGVPPEAWRERGLPRPTRCS
jgi:hypothetical protein